MAQPGASSVFYGGSVVYNTRKAKKILLDDDELHKSILSSSVQKEQGEDFPLDEDSYIQSKLEWTAKTSVAYCKALQTDFAIAEGGASGPTFQPDGMQSGFAALAVAGYDSDVYGKGERVVKVLKQLVVRSDNADRKGNMRMFADAAADLVTEVIESQNKQDGVDEEEKIIGKESNRSKNEEKHFDGYESKNKIFTLPVDRATHIRSNSKKLSSLEPLAYYILLKDSKHVLVTSEISNELAFLTYDEVEEILSNITSDGESIQKTFLGFLHDTRTAVFGIDLSSNDMNTSKNPIENVINYISSPSLRLSLHGCSFIDTRTSAPLFSPLHNQLALHATALAQWQRNSPFCSKCGSSSTVLLNGGTERLCTNCNTTTWPRQDPSMIVAISSRSNGTNYINDRRILLARSKRHPPKLHTTLAGFVEVGETFEEAVARETYEEVGIYIDEGSVQYVGSQPWPFPQSCMVGFTAVADDTQPLNVDEKELLSASWFNAEEVRAAANVEGAVMKWDVAEAALKCDPNLRLLIPPRGVIARDLIDTWLAGNKGSSNT